jgi:predicted TIM-barrel fold metal-dependent hydrolase
MSTEPLQSTPTRAASTLTHPGFEMPKHACDSHVHVFGPQGLYPRVPHPHYTLPDGAPPLLDAMTSALGIERFAIVQPSYYGTDNGCLLDALDALGERGRGVAMVEENVDYEVLEAMHARGVRALRLDLFLRADWPTDAIVKYVQRSAQRVQRFGWHLQFYTPGRVIRDLVPMLADLESDFVIDHMGYMLESDGLTRADFDRLIAAVQRGRGWMKLSGPYRLAKDGNFERLRPFARAIVDALGERTVWGSDWPHIPNGQMDTGQLLNLLAHWVPDDRERNRILADNPGRLYGYTT